MHLFIAHHKDDNLETFLNRKIAGSDFYGLKSMSEFSLYNNVCIIRPLLNFSKVELFNYNKKNKIEYINDPSNFNLDYTRPTIRNFLKKSDQKTIKEINKDFERILFYSPFFIQMIFEILLKNIVKIDSKNIIFPPSEVLDALCDDLIHLRLLLKSIKFLRIYRMRQIMIKE